MGTDDELEVPPYPSSLPLKLKAQAQAQAQYSSVARQWRRLEEAEARRWGSSGHVHGECHVDTYMLPSEVQRSSTIICIFFFKIMFFYLILNFVMLFWRWWRKMLDNNNFGGGGNMRGLFDGHLPFRCFLMWWFMYVCMALPIFLSRYPFLFLFSIWLDHVTGAKSDISYCYFIFFRYSIHLIAILLRTRRKQAPIRLSSDFCTWYLIPLK